jgi:hypothetical protein
MSDKLNQALELLNQSFKEIVGSMEQTPAGQGSQFLEIKSDANNSIYGKGILWKGQGNPKQFVFNKPDKFFSSEDLDLGKDKQYFINANPVISENGLGPTVLNSNLQKVGRLKGLVVDGNVLINQYLFYNAANDRLGLGTEEPNAALSIAEEGIEIIVGTHENSKGRIGTYGCHDIDIVTDNTPRISVEANGNITLGNRTHGPVKVQVVGKMSVNVKTADPRVDLHVAGPIKFHERIHQYLDDVPDAGTWNRGDVVWNTAPEAGKSVGWVCVRAGTPGTWLPFGIINARG